MYKILGIMRWPLTHPRTLARGSQWAGGRGRRTWRKGRSSSRGRGWPAGIEPELGGAPFLSSRPKLPKYQSIESATKDSGKEINKKLDKDM